MIKTACDLKYKIAEVIAKKIYQNGYPDWRGINVLKLPLEPGAQPGVTWCNAAGNEILLATGFDTRPILHPQGIGMTNANAMYMNAVASAARPLSGVIEITGRLAQALANLGIAILAAAPNPKGPGHIAIVSPDDSTYDDSRGPFTGDAGARNDFNYAVRQFAGLSPIKYFLLPLKTA
jgi:hypothetical protein